MALFRDCTAAADCRQQMENAITSSIPDSKIATRRDLTKQMYGACVQLTHVRRTAACCTAEMVCFQLHQTISLAVTIQQHGRQLYNH